LVFVGHDGAGKTTPREAGRAYVKPFDDSLGDHMSWLWKRGRFAEVNSLALSTVERMIDLNPEGPRVFDRHWATVFSILPEEHWAAWQPVPPTVVCQTDAETTYRRLLERSEDPQDLGLHAYYQRIYSELASWFDALVIDTASRLIEACLNAARAARERQVPAQCSEGREASQ
jgi:hypothetical protein